MYVCRNVFFYLQEINCLHMSTLLFFNLCVYMCMYTYMYLNTLYVCMYVCMWDFSYVVTLIWQKPS
jgi:hypothetical protein